VRVRWLILPFFSVAAAASGAPSQDSVTRDVAARIRTAAPGHEVRIVGPLTIEVARSGLNEPLSINVDRVWNVCRQGSPQDCVQSAENFVRAIPDLLGEMPALTRERLRETVRSEEYCREVRRGFGDRGQTVLTRAAPAGLCAMLVADSPNSVRLLTTEDLETLQMSPDEAWQLAERQTLAILPRPTDFDVGRQYVMVTGQDYLPSLILATDGWRSLAAAQGDIMLAVPADGRIIVLRAIEGADLRQLQSLVAEDFRTAERGISPHILRWTEAGWRTVD
jgi:hypothetical protein